jgi:hypothetical protein
VKYQGSKTRLAKAIGGIIRPALRDGGRYVEPFVGSCAVAVQLVPDADISALSDAHLDMVLLWNAAIDGWTPPTTVTYEDHQRLKDAEPSPLRVTPVCGWNTATTVTPMCAPVTWCTSTRRTPVATRTGRRVRSTVTRSGVRRGSGQTPVHTSTCPSTSLRRIGASCGRPNVRMPSDRTAPERL